MAAIDRIDVCRELRLYIDLSESKQKKWRSSRDNARSGGLFQSQIHIKSCICKSRIKPAMLSKLQQLGINADGRYARHYVQFWR